MIMDLCKTELLLDRQRTVFSFPLRLFPGGFSCRQDRETGIGWIHFGEYWFIHDFSCTFSLKNNLAS